MPVIERRPEVLRGALGSFYNTVGYEQNFTEWAEGRMREGSRQSRRHRWMWMHGKRCRPVIPKERAAAEGWWVDAFALRAGGVELDGQ